MAALELAELILRAFFGGDPVAWREDGPGHPGFRGLLRHPRLEPSPSTVWYALGVWEQYHALPESLASALSLAHHRALLPVRQPDRKLALARAAVRYKWSKRRLEKEVRAEPEDARKGRPRKLAFVRTAQRVREALAEALAASHPPDEVRRHGVREARRTIRTLREDLRALEALTDSWEAVVRGIREDR